MKKYLVLLFVAMFLFTNCSKDDDDPAPVVIVPGVTTVSGTASFPAGSSGDLSNAKVSIYTSWDNWNNNIPIQFDNVQGSGAQVSFILTNMNAGNYYLDIWKDVDGNASWTTGDFVGWYGAVNSLGSPNLTEFQISDEESKTFQISMIVWP